MSVPYYLRPKDTRLEAGPDESLEPDVAPTDAERRSLPPNLWPATDSSRGPKGPPDKPLTGPATDPARRMVPPSTWPRLPVPPVDNRPVGELAPDPITLDPDIALWQSVIVSIWPFTGPPTTGVWPRGWLGIDNTATLYVCTVAGAPGTWTAVAPPTQNSNGSLGGPFTVTGTLSTFLQTSPLAAGLWLVNVSGLVTVAPSSTVEIQANYGTAVGASLAGTQAAELQNPSATVNLNASFTLSFLATIATAGTLVFQTISATGSNIIQAATTVHTYPETTGYTAIKVG